MRYKKLSWDLETGSEIDLTVVGSYRYANHESTFIRLFIYAFDNKPAECWQCEREPMPEVLRTSLLDDSLRKDGFNTIGFDCEVLESCEGIYIPTEAQRDIMVRSAKYGLAGKLSKLTEEFLPDDQQKLDTGTMLIELFGRPLSQQRKTKVRDAFIAAGYAWANWETHPNEWALYIEYGIRDVESARAYDDCLPTWNEIDIEDEVLRVDRLINRRGIHIDRHYVEQCALLTDIQRDKIKQQVMALTGGVSPRSFKKFKIWIQNHLPGRVVKGTSKDVIAELIEEGGLPEVVSQVFDLCGQATSSSIAKFHTMLNYAMPDDDRMYWLMRIYGGGPVGRWAGRGPQPHNYPRPRVAKGVLIDTPEVIEHFINCTSIGLLPNEGMKVAVSSLRAAITPVLGKKYLNSDFASVEGRVLAWVAGETSVLEAYAEGKNLYLMNGAVFGVPYEEMSKKHKLYMLCKVLELALGYQGGVGAFMSMAKGYDLNVHKLAEDLHEHDLIPERLLHQANKLYHNPKFRKAVQSTGLDQFTWCYLDAVKRAWRERRPATTTFWRKVDECVRNALDNPGIEFTCGNRGMISIEYDLESNFLGIRLPSGRIITYYKPKISGRNSAHDGEEGEDADTYETVIIDGVEHAVLSEKPPAEKDNDTIISYLTLTEKGWTKVYSHGGKFTNNIVQGIARDLMANALVRLEEGKWFVVLHVHDETLCELDISDPRTAKDLEDAMCDLPDWADGLIIVAEGKEVMRFEK